MFFQVFITVATLVGTSTQAVFYTEDKAVLKTTWDNYKQKWEKKYATPEEETLRFNIFVDKLQVIDWRNARELQVGGTAVHGLTQFSDLTSHEFRSTYLTTMIRPAVSEADSVEITRPVDMALDLVDWTGIYTTPIKNQEQCGSCWAFSATEQIESDVMREHNKTFTLSVQQVNSCTTGCGCELGGFTESAYKYVKNAGGLEKDSDYPYTSHLGKTGSCLADSSTIAKKGVVSIGGYTAVKSDEATMASYVQSTGPLSICVDADSWDSYTSGIMSTCSSRNIDHCVQAVGVATKDGYWKVRNSWGATWGEKGYIRIAYGKNNCGLNNDPTFVTGTKLL